MTTDNISDDAIEVIEIFVSAYHALRSYQFGNRSEDFAKSIADKMEPYLPREVVK